jgi:hypothetical protein
VRVVVGVDREARPKHARLCVVLVDAHQVAHLIHSTCTYAPSRTHTDAHTFDQRNLILLAQLTERGQLFAHFNQIEVGAFQYFKYAVIIQLNTCVCVCMCVSAPSFNRA